MAIVNQQAKKYASVIKDAIRSDGFPTNKKIHPSDLIGSNTHKAINIVKRDIGRLTYDFNGRRLTEDDKRKIIDEINRELGLPRTIKRSDQLSESASNDDLSDLADAVEKMLRGKK